MPYQETKRLNESERVMKRMKNYAFKRDQCSEDTCNRNCVTISEEDRKNIYKAFENRRVQDQLAMAFQ